MPDNNFSSKIHMGNNIIPVVNYIMANMPEDLSDIEKVRYIYLKLGNIFSYDYRIMKNLDVINEQIDYSSSSINKYQTCIHISEILALLLNNIDANCKAQVITRPMEGRDYMQDHVAVEVEFKDGLKILLDLTLDLFLIQSGMQTKQFGFTTNIEGDYDIISLKECREMDKKLGYIKEDYTNKKIMDLKNELDSKDYSNMSKREIIEYKISQIKEKLLVKFSGNYESMRYIANLFLTILNKDELSELKQYNLEYEHVQELYLLNIFMFNDSNLVYSYTNELGLEETTYSSIKNLLNRGWKTNSNTLETILSKKIN